MFALEWLSLMHIRTTIDSIRPLQMGEVVTCPYVLSLFLIASAVQFSLNNPWLMYCRAQKTVATRLTSFIIYTHNNVIRYPHKFYVYP